eukprot:scaffold1681_cov242-Prasinococcus_capsulatus_cf.AAC.2
MQLIVRCTTRRDRIRTALGDHRSLSPPRPRQPAVWRVGGRVRRGGDGERGRGGERRGGGARRGGARLRLPPAARRRQPGRGSRARRRDA